MAAAEQEQDSDKAIVGRIPIDDFEPPEVDLKGAFNSIYALPHRFFVAVPPQDTMKGRFHIPDRTARVERLPIGVVIAAGFDTDLAVGEHVIVQSRYAKVIHGLTIGNFHHSGEIWMFGITSPHVRECRIVNVKHTAIAVVGATEWESERANFPKPDAEPNDTGYRPHDGQFPPTWAGKGEGRLLLRLQEKSNMHGSLYVPDNLSDRPDIGTVVDVSGQCRHVKPGDQVMYLRRGLESMYPDGHKDLAFAPEKAIYAVIRG